MKDEWCDQRDVVYDPEKTFRCTKCGRRLKPQTNGQFDSMFDLPPHKKKGYKIKRKKGHNKRKKDKVG
jgi:hypothetical protein